MCFQQEEYLLGIMTERAYHPGMAMQIERLNSFDNFFSDSSKTKEQFAEAGFFFTGEPLFGCTGFRDLLGYCGPCGINL